MVFVPSENAIKELEQGLMQRVTNLLELLYIESFF